MKKPLALLRSISEFLAKPRKMLIDGQPSSAVSDLWIKSPDPATGKIIGHFPNAGAEDVERAVPSAQRAQHSWALRPTAVRQQFRHFLAENIERHSEEFAQLISLDQGKPIPEAASEVASTVRFLQQSPLTPATPIAHRDFDLAPDSMTAHRDQPLGPVAVLTASSFPLLYPILQSIPALLAGNAVMIKPAEKTSLVLLRLAELIATADIPPGTVQIITGAAKTAGHSLAAHPAINALSVTGSPSASRAVAQAAAERLIPSSLFPSRKSAGVIFADADQPSAVKAIVSSATYCTGQADGTLARLFIERSVFKEIVQQISASLESIRLGHPLDPQTQLGPVASLDQQMRVLGHIEMALEEGMELVTGSKTPYSHASEGFFVQPTLLVAPKLCPAIFEEDVFGPVIEAIAFDELQAIGAAAEQRPFRSMAIWAGDVPRAQKLAISLPARFISINVPFDPNQQALNSFELARVLPSSALTQRTLIVTRLP